MRKVILFIAFLTTSLAANAQSTEKYSSTKSKFYYSFVWGLLTSKNYPKDKSAVFEFEKPKVSNSLSEPPSNSTKYEQKSILWGAIQWTEKKNNVSSTTSESNGK
ncbi:MAG: hypothetical protein ACK6BQ_04585 [Bacteroidota bacterium]